MSIDRVDLAGALLVGVASVPVLRAVPWFRRGGLAERLAPYRPVGSTAPDVRRRAASWHEVLAPLAAGAGNRISGLFGVHEDLGRRLERVGRAPDVAVFRLRQVGGALAALTVTLMAMLVLGVGPAGALLLALAGGLLAFLLPEQSLNAEVARRRRQLEMELPVIAEQLGMLLSAGFSLTGALHRIAGRGQGVCAEDLGRVTRRVRQGLSDTAALQEWADLVDLDHVTRLVNVLRLNREAGDLGGMISEEARSIRRALHRNLLEEIEKRGQQVWIPVTVATLVPGVIFMAVPFLEAVRGLTG